MTTAATWNWEKPTDEMFAAMIEAEEAAIAEYEMAADRAMKALEDRWIDNGCSNSYDCDEDYFRTPL